MFDAEREFKRLFDKSIADNRLAGANVLIIRNGEEQFFGSYGMANREVGKPMTRDSVFRMFSMSKPITSVAVLMLMERGIIDLKDPVCKYLDGFINQKVAVGNKLVPVKRPVTIADLMNMTSGVSYPGDQDASHIAVARCTDEWEKKLRSYDHPGTVDFANAIGKCPLAFQPGEKWMYGYSADILGAVVEVASGMSFGEFLATELFSPLGMSSTGFSITPSMRERLTEAYEDDPEEGGIRPFRGMNLALGDFPDRPIFESGGAGILSTIDDYSRFAMMLANEGTYNGIRILSKNTVRFMRTNQLTDAQRIGMDWDSLQGHGYGNLVRVLENVAVQSTNGVPGEFGWDGWLGTYFIVEPETRNIILFLRQKTNAGSDDITRKVRAISYAI